MSSVQAACSLNGEHLRVNVVSVVLCCLLAADGVLQLHQVALMTRASNTQLVECQQTTTRHGRQQLRRPDASCLASLRDCRWCWVVPRRDNLRADWCGLRRSSHLLPHALIAVFVVNLAECNVQSSCTGHSGSVSRQTFPARTLFADIVQLTHMLRAECKHSGVPVSCTRAPWLAYLPHRTAVYRS